MSNPVKPIPDGYTSVTPYLFIQGAAAALDFYKRVFGAQELMRMPMPENRVGHAEISINGSKIMLADECPQIGASSPKAYGGSGMMIHLYVQDVDATFREAIAAGGKVRQPVENKFYGDRSGTFEDPFGHLWGVATHIEDVTPEEMRERMEAMMKPA